MTGSDGKPDRTYKAEDWDRHLKDLISNGIFAGGPNLQVTADGSGMSVVLDIGAAWINGKHYLNDQAITFQIDAADGALNRADRIVIRLDTAGRYIRAQYKKGTFASTAVPPDLQRDADGWELCLADVSIPAGTTAITQSLITDTRLDNDVCGIVTGVVQQVDTTTLYAQIQDDLTRFRATNEADFTAWVQGLKDVLDDETAGNLLNLITTHTSDTNNPHHTTPEQIGAVQGNTKAWVATEATAGDSWATDIVVPNFLFSEGCTVTYKAPQSPTESNPAWANRLQIRHESGGTIIGVYALSTLNKEPLPADIWTTGAMVTVTLSNEVVSTWGNLPTAFFKGGAPSVPSIFGTGADGDAVISGTVTLPVEVPHQSIVEKNYKSLIINAGAILKCASWNAGLILRVQGDCTIHGTIDQSGLAPKTNPQNNYPYPAQLVCGDGGDGGNTGYGHELANKFLGGTGMLKRTYGGGYGAGGAGGGGGGHELNYYTDDGGKGGDSTNITIDTPDSDLFKGGTASGDNGNPGTYGGGGSGGGGVAKDGTSGIGGAGGAEAGANGRVSSENSGAGGGGAGNYGGGVVLLYVGGNLLIDGRILCNGLSGGNGGNRAYYNDDGAGGGGGGAGAIYILHRGTYTNTGALQVNGGAAGATGSAGIGARPGNAGGIGSITVIQGDK